MRLKTIRKKRPAFENEGTVISGSRMDLSNTDGKSVKHRSNNSFALPTSLHNDLSSLNISMSDHIHEIPVETSQHTFKNQQLNNPAPSQATIVSSYQAIEAACLEHGIRIQLNSTTAAAVSQQQSQTNMNTSDRKSASTLHRLKVFVNRNPSRSSSALHYSNAVPEAYHDSRPFSALQQTSTTDFDETETHDASFIQNVGNQPLLQNQEHLTYNYCASSILVSEPFDNMILSGKAADNNDQLTITTTLENDPDFAYMTTLLKTPTGDSYRDNIRRRAGLRPTFAVHRHPESTTATSTITATTTSTKSKTHEKLSIAHSPTANVQKSSMHHSTVTVTPIAPPSKKKVEKDIVRHATRIRASQMKDYSNHQEHASRSKLSYQPSPLSNSPTRTNYPIKQYKTNRSTKSINLEPLELLLAHAPRPSSLRTPSPINSYPLRAFSCVNRHNHQKDVMSSINCTKLHAHFSNESNSTIHHDVATNFLITGNSQSSPLNDEKLTLTKTSMLGMIPNNTTNQSSSIDSGCYDRSSCSGDTHSITSGSINHTSSSIPSTRLASANTRRSNISKKVSFQDQPRTIILTTTIYI